MLLPSYVCSAVLNAVVYTRALPGLVDIDPADFNCDPADARKKCTGRVRAMVVPHLFGLSARLGELLSLGIPVIEDCAQSVGAAFRGRKLGSLGSLGVYSFYATKGLVTGEGGMVVARSRRLIAKVRDLRDYDERKDYRPRHNYKMTEIEAALGMVQLGRLAGFIRRRRSLARSYTLALEGTGLRLPRGDRERPHTFYRYVVAVPGSARTLARALGRAGVEAKPPVFRPLHRYLGLDGRRFPGTEEAARRALSLPIYPLLSERDLGRSARSLLRALERGGGR